MMFELSKDNFISPGSIGGKIKRIREHKGWTQKELGLRCGFSQSSADVRIRQYESNKKVPREKALKTLTEALGIEEHALFDADFLVMDDACHALFDIEDFHGLHPVEINGRYYLEFSGPTMLNPHGIREHEQDDFLKAWLRERKKWLPERRDTEEEKREKQKQYDLWRFEYPRNVTKETTQRLRLRAKKEKLEKELQAVMEELGE
ncbi:MAG: helix-turn-helix transcriptional regulator [Eubacterium sp.]|nr:helix-turn-helix transcriptional regulator [Eubacterium sp.]